VYTVFVIRRVEIGKRAAKQLRVVPCHIRDKLAIWIIAVELEGLEEVRKVRGYHDEPLGGKRSGQRSIWLSRSYRAIYEIRRGTVEFVMIQEVSKHEY